MSTCIHISFHPFSTKQMLFCGNTIDLAYIHKYITKEVCLWLDETIYVSRRHIVHLRRKCRDCGAVGTIKMVPGNGDPVPHTRSRRGKEVALMSFDCDGLEHSRFLFRNLSPNVLISWKEISTKNIHSSRQA